MKSQLLETKINECYVMLDDAYVTAMKDSHILIGDKQTVRAAKALDKCIAILEKVKGHKK